MINHQDLYIFSEQVPHMYQNSAMDRCVDELSSTLELARALEFQLKKVHEAVSREKLQGDPGSTGFPQHPQIES